MLNIVLFGAGNVATHLYHALQKSETTQVIQVYNRSAENLQSFKNKVPTTTSYKDLKAADVYLISVSDHAVSKVIDQIPHTNALIAHTAGSVPLLNSAKHNGVFYPLQTFSKQTEVDFAQIPICVEASSNEDLNVLKQLATSISKNKVYTLSFEQRKTLHLSAVFACNFTNHLYRIAEKLCKQDDIPFEIMQPLIMETARKITLDSPKNVQTGPAKRKDQKTIDTHLKQLKSADLKEIYTLLTQLIQKENGTKL